ncbi:MAG: DUF2147 domain-containing protein [Bdellovibrionota bacterium]|nr:DUF2147 domain-containing protein [Bdellovibrionota bacterium]
MRITKMCASLLLISLSLSVLAEDKVKADDVLGFWLSESKKGVVEIYKKGDEFEGKLVWIKDIHDGKVEDKLDINNPEESERKKSLKGLVNLKGFKFDGNEWTGGTIYDPQKGKTYKAFMKMDGNDKLKIRGYIGISLFGRTTEWERQKSAVPDSYSK